MSRTPLIAAVLLAAAPIAGCGGKESAGDAQAATAKTVTVRTFQFTPDPLRVKRGTTVRWVNTDDTVHTVTSKRFDRRLAPKTGTTRITFRRAGTFKYVCKLHSGPGMRAVVVVR